MIHIFVQKWPIELFVKYAINKFVINIFSKPIKVKSFDLFLYSIVPSLSAKVHGIHNGTPSNENSDHTPPTMVPVSTENESSDAYCSICQKDFSSKYLYLFHMQTIHNDPSDATYQNLLELMKATNALNEDESDGNIEKLKRKRSLSQSSTEKNKRRNSLSETNGGLQPFLIESEDPKFAHTFVPCMVYLPVIKRVTKQVKINLRLKPVLTDTPSS